MPPQFDWPPRPLPSLDAALRDVGSQKGSFRRNAAIALGRAPADRAGEAARALTALLGDEERAVRIEAVYAAAALGARELSEAIAGKLGSGDPDERVAALEYMAALDDASRCDAVAALVEQDAEVPVRCMALETLASLDAPRALGACLEIVEARTQEVPVMRTALVLLRSVGDASHAGAVAASLQDPRRGVSLEAAATLAHMGDGRGRPRLLDEATNPAREEERVVALEALGRIVDDDVAAVAARRASGLLVRRDEKAYWTGILASRGDADALARLRTQIAGTHPMRAALALRVAGLCSLASLVPVIESLICDADADEGLVVEGIESLGLMRCDEAAEALARIATTDGSQARALDARAALQEVRRWTRS